MIRNLTLILTVILVGCSTPPDPDRCDQWKKAVEIYNLAIASGHQPSEDEVRVAATAQALMAVYCGGGAK